MKGKQKKAETPKEIVKAQVKLIPTRANWKDDYPGIDSEDIDDWFKSPNGKSDREDKDSGTKNTS